MHVVVDLEGDARRRSALFAPRQALRFDGNEHPRFDVGQHFRGKLAELGLGEAARERQSFGALPDDVDETEGSQRVARSPEPVGDDFVEIGAFVDAQHDLRPFVEQTQRWGSAVRRPRAPACRRARGAHPRALRAARPDTSAQRIAPRCVDDPIGDEIAGARPVPRIRSARARATSTHRCAPVFRRR